MNGEYRIGDTVFGSWTLVKLLGEGSYGKVYEAHREDFGTTYTAAIKIMTIPRSQSEIQSARAEGMDEESVKAYFRSLVGDVVQEFALMSRLKGSANIVSYEDHSVTPLSEGIGWDVLIRMELLTPMLNYMERHPMTRSDVIKLGIDMCKALELCQRYNIIHRDIKPENIFISNSGDYKLGDFGVARTLERTMGGLSKKGTYTYMAPETYRGEEYGSTVDIYSLGIVLYRLLNNNRAPFLPQPPKVITHTDRESALERRISGEPLPAPANAEGRLAEIVLKACAYDPKDRYSSPLQMRQELEAIQYKRGEDAAIYGNRTQIDVNHKDFTHEGSTSDDEATVCYDEETVRVSSKPKTEEDEDATVIINEKPYTPKNNTGDDAAQEKSVPKSKKKNGLIIGAVAAIALLAAVLIFFLTKRDTDPPESEQTLQAAAIAETEQIQTVTPTAAIKTTHPATATPEPASDDKTTLPVAVTPIPESRNVQIDKIRNASVGDYITFGAYEQDNETTNGKEDIEWQVLVKESSRILVISRYALDCQEYNTKSTSVTWETCTLRYWLNDNFFNTAFTSEEQDYIIETAVTADKNPYYWSLPANDTEDKVFLLSATEASKYFNSDNVRQCQKTAYVKAQGAYTTTDGNCWWWLRSPGDESYRTTYVSSDGLIDFRGDSVSVSGYVVRPALWISLESLALSSSSDSTTPVPESRNVQMDKIRNASVGDYIMFGAYEQDNDTTNGKEDIEWQVLVKEKNRMLVISRYALDCQMYNNTLYTDVTWETCTLRKWLNDSFLKSAFSAVEQDYILKSKVTADKNPDYDTSSGNDTVDQVFLLSIIEVNKYYNSKSERQCRPTAYAIAKGSYKYDNGNCVWWLRSPGYVSDEAAYISMDGSIYSDDVRVFRDAVRPALWIDLGS